MKHHHRLVALALVIATVVASLVGMAGPARPAAAVGPTLVPLDAFYSPTRKDYFTTTAPAWTGCRTTCGGYDRVGRQGLVYNPDNPQPAGTVPLYHWWSDARADNLLTTLPVWAGRPGDVRDGYRMVRVEGYVPTIAGADTRPLEGYWSTGATDNAAMAYFGLGGATPAGYARSLTRGHVFRADATPWVIDAQRLDIARAQEGDDDEPYLAVIQYRVRPGERGSTAVRYLGNPAELSESSAAGARLAVPDGMGRAYFPDVDRVGDIERDAGEDPEVMGVVAVALESDNSPFSTIDGIMNEAAGGLDRALRERVETMTDADLRDPTVLRARLDQVATAVREASETTVWEDIVHGLVSGFDPDDQIAMRIVLRVGVDDDLAGEIDLGLALAGLPPTVFAGPLQRRTVTGNFAGGGASYNVTWDVVQA